MSGDSLDLFDLAQARRREAQRRLAIVGPLVNQPNNSNLFRERSRETGVPVPVLRAWVRQYCFGGEDALLPDWQELDPASRRIALDWYKKLEPYADADTISPADYAALAKSLGRSERSARRSLDRYRIGGLWGLTPKYNPFAPKRPRSTTDDLPRDVGALDEGALEVIYQRYEMLGPLAKKASVTNAEVCARAAEVNSSRSTLWNYLRMYRMYGLAGLAPRERADKGQLHGVSDQMVDLVRGIRLSNCDWPVRAVYEAAQVKAGELQVSAPSLWQVRQIIAMIPKPVLMIADKRENRFRNSYRFTAPINHSDVVYQIDHCLVDILALDKRQPAYQTTSRQIRCWLTLVIDSASRCVVAFSFSYDRPNRHTVANVIRNALLAQPGGVPGSIWVDNGKDLISHHVRQLTRELDIELHPCAPHQPQHRGIIERFFGTLNSGLWSRLPGYVASNTVDRNPSTKAILTIKDLENELSAFLDQYHHEIQESIGMSPIDYWTEHCFAMPVDSRQLDMLLKEPSNRKVLKQGIKFDGRIYWHQDLGLIVGDDVLVRAETRYEPPDEVEVFHDGRWFCTAFALDSTRGLALTSEEIAIAQRNQRKHLHKQVDESRAVLASADDKIRRQSRGAPAVAVDAASVLDGSKDTEQQSDQQHVQAPSLPVARKKSAPEKDFLMRMATNQSKPTDHNGGETV